MRGGGDFGDYLPAVEKWETLTDSKAPYPVVPPVRRGKNRLSPKFVEWMMGLPEGWVTNVPGLTYQQQIRMLGNGVVPQQGAKAISDLLGDFMDEEKEA